MLVPDLYHGKTTKDAAEAQKLMTELDTLHAVKDIRAAIAFAKAHERSNGKVGVMGFCMGGALTLATAAHVGTEIAAAVPFYGIPPAEKADLTKIAVPVQMHVGKHDAWVTPAKAEDVKSKVKAPFELHIYDADHAFVNDTRPEVYSPENAKLAWSRAMAFFEKHLAS